MAERNQNIAIPVEEVEDEQMHEVNVGPGKVKEESNYVSVVTSSQDMPLPLREDQTVQYQTIDHKATKVSCSHYLLTNTCIRSYSSPACSSSIWSFVC